MCFSYRLPTGSVLIKAHQFSDQAPPSTSGEPRLQHQVSPQYQTIPTRITRRSPSLLPCEPRPQHQTSPKPGGPHPRHRPGEPHQHQAKACSQQQVGRLLILRRVPPSTPCEPRTTPGKPQPHDHASPALSTG